MKTSERYSIQVVADEQDGGFVAISSEFPGISAYGATREDAMSEMRTALELAIEAYLEEGWPLPVPSVFSAPELPSGSFRVRLPRSIHAQLGQRAIEEGTSQNQLVVTYVVAGLAGRLGNNRADDERRVLKNQKPPGRG